MSTAIADLAAAFERHPDWPDSKFPSRQAFLAYAIATARYAASRDIGRRAVDSWEETGAEPATEVVDQAAAEQLVELVGSVNAAILRLRYEGESLDAIAEAVSALGHALEADDVADRLALLSASHPQLTKLLPAPDEAALSTFAALVARRVPSLGEIDVSLVAARLAGLSYAEIQQRFRSRGHKPYAPNALRQRIHRAANSNPWLRQRLQSAAS